VDDKTDNSNNNYFFMIIPILPLAHTCYRQMDIAMHLYHLMTNSHKVSRSVCPRPLCILILLYLSNLYTLIPPTNTNTVLQLFKCSVKANSLTILLKYLYNLINRVRLSATCLLFCSCSNVGKKFPEDIS